jgi:hypothetical protein
MSFCTANTLFGSILASEPEAIVLAYSTPQAGFQPLGSALSISSGDFDSVGELYLEDDFWQLRPNFHKKEFQIPSFVNLVARASRIPLQTLEIVVSIAARSSARLFPGGNASSTTGFPIHRT